MKDLKGKSAIVTGAGRGIGKRLALGLAQAGCRVALLARTEAQLQLAQLEIEARGGIGLPYAADVCQYDTLAEVFRRIREDLGPADILVTAAGMQGPIGPFWETDLADWRQTLDTNLIGTINAVRIVLPEMVARRRGKVVVLGGRGVSHARPFFTAYAASKAALGRTVESLSEELSEHNVQINCLAPGNTYTHMTDQILAAGERAGWRDQEMAVKVRQTGGVAPNKQIEPALFLASSQSNHITGKIIHVDDDWKTLLESTIPAELYTLRRVQRA
ncbi:MAG: SDR family oxidoreductase [Bryobacterales bacterium]|nr:SDR family oxidoreductase [Bryobacterales bacterium]